MRKRALRKWRLLPWPAALALTLALAGCRGEVTAESLYEEAAQTWRKADRVAMDLTLETSISQNGGSVQNNLEGTLYHLGKTGENPTLYLDGNMNLDLGSGSPMSVPLSYVYWEGCLYADLAGVRYRQNMTPEQMEAQAYQGLGLFDRLDAEDFRNLTLQDGTDSRTLSFGIGAENVRTVAESLAQIRSYQEAYGEGLTMNFADAEGTFVLSEEGVPQSMSVQISADLSAEGFAASLSFQITETYRGFNEAVEVTLPDLSGYEDLGDGGTQETEGEASPSESGSPEGESSPAESETADGESTPAGGESQTGEGA